MKKVATILLLICTAAFAQQKGFFTGTRDGTIFRKNGNSCLETLCICFVAINIIFVVVKWIIPVLFALFVIGGSK